MVVKKTQKPVSAILIGAGTRGRDAYGTYAINNPERLKFIAVADKDEAKRVIFQKIHNIPDENVYSSWEELLSNENGKMAQVAFICTPDIMHFKPAMKALELDYDLVLEKPIAPTVEECRKIASQAKEKGRLVQVCHVLRYTDFWKTVKKIVTSGLLGKIIHMDHSENVSYWHFGHSFVRGEYKNKDTSTAIVLAKTCHDLDIIHWIMEEKANDVFSVGEVTHYKSENAPEDAPLRCLDGCSIENECPWYAPRLYIDLEPLLRTGLYAENRLLKLITKGILKSKTFRNFVALFYKDLRRFKKWDQFPVTAITTDYTKEGKMKALREGPYGLCIYKTGNDVPDHQITTITFPSGATTTLTMHGFSEHEGRELKIFGTKGVLRGTFRNSLEVIEFTDFVKGKTKILYKKPLSAKGHGGGDEKIMEAFTTIMMDETMTKEENITDVSSAMESHYMGFAAEESRLTGKKQIMIDFRE